MDTFEKKYNEAMLRADEAVQKGCLDKFTFDEIFPPSEDELTRKKLIRFINSPCVQEYLTPSDSFEFVAWLEKQKEQKPCGCVNVESEYDKGWRAGHKAGLKDAELQKPAWGEEDRRILDNILDILAMYGKEHNPVTEAFIQQDISWLKNRLKSLCPQKDCNGCSKHLEGYISGRGDAENKLLEQYGILIMPEGELRMKPRWKPSEEQIAAFKNSVEHIPNAYYDDMWELYEQLKKL